jgi:hypothetical protein
MPSKDQKLNESERPQEQSLHIKLDKRILAALKRESKARGGQQEHRITEEALALYFGLKSVLGRTGLTGSSGSGGNAGSLRKYSRIVE